MVGYSYNHYATIVPVDTLAWQLSIVDFRDKHKVKLIGVSFSSVACIAPSFLWTVAWQWPCLPLFFSQDRISRCSSVLKLAL